MKRGRFIISIVVLFVCWIIVAALLHTNAKPDLGAGPTYNGRTVMAWIESIQIANPDDAGITNLIGIGGPALPFLVRAVEWKPSPSDLLAAILARRGWWKTARWLHLNLSNPEDTRRRYYSKRGAIQVLARLGPVAKKALPSLRQVARDSDWGDRAFALSAIGSIGPEPTDMLLMVNALADEHSLVRTQGAKGLGRLGNLSEEAITALRNALHDQDEGVRKHVSAALRKIDPNATAKSDAAAEAGVK